MAESKDLDKWEERHVPAVPGSVKEITLTTTSGMLALLVQQGADLTTLEKFMDLKEREEKDQARKAFVKAIVAFKADPPEIYKDKENKQFKSKYSSISALVNSAIPKLSKYGLSHSWKIGEANGKPQVTCFLIHELGHQENAIMSAPPDVSGGGSKNPIQQIKSTQTYLKIATFEAVTGLVSQEGSFDDDGNASAPVVLINDTQFADITTLQKDANISDAEFTKRLKKKFKADKLEDLTTTQAEELIRALGAVKC